MAQDRRARDREHKIASQTLRRRKSVRSAALRAEKSKIT